MATVYGNNGWSDKDAPHSGRKDGSFTQADRAGHRTR